MRMSIPRGIAACAIVVVPLISVALLSTPAFAVKQSSVLAACSRTKGCWTVNTGNGGVAGCSPNACFECYNKNCHRTSVTATGGAKIQRGPNAVVTTSTSSRGSIPIQTGATAVINSTPVRPTGPSGSFHGKGR
jgi:hypothetical protein